MFNEMPVMASRGLVKVLFNLLLLHHCFHIPLIILSYHSILGSDLGFGPKKVAQILGMLAQNSKNWSLVDGKQAFESVSGFLDALIPIEWEWIWLKMSKGSGGPKGKLFEVLD